MELTEEDSQVAKLASALLVEQGRPDLAVSPRQLVRWRQEAHAIPVEGERRGGRRRSTRYRPEAPQVAAAIALALDDKPQLTTEEAVLRVYGEAVGYGVAAPPDFDGVRSALVRYLADAQRTAAQAWKYRGARPRSDIPRSLRVPFATSRQAAPHVVSDAVLAVMLGLDPEDGQVVGGAYGVETMVGEMVPEIASALPAKELRQRLRRSVESMALAALRQTAQVVEPVEFARRCRQMAILHDYNEALRECMLLTTGSPSALPAPLDALAMLSSGVDRIKAHRGLRVVILGLAAFTHAADQHSQRQLRENAMAAEPHIDAMRACSEVAKLLPAHLRPVLAPGTGPLFLAQLPDEERALVQKTVQTWLDAHPAARHAVERSQVAAERAVESAGP